MDISYNILITNNLKMSKTRPRYKSEKAKKGPKNMSKIRQKRLILRAISL